jgi:P-type Na+/K+ transporter
MAASFYIKAQAEAGVLAVVIASNIIVGFWMELSGQKQMQSLKSLGSTTISVVRNGEAKVLETMHVVPGDLVELKVGDCVPADVRLIETFNLETKEMNMTGESDPVHKDARVVCDETTEASSRRNIAFHSTTVEKGRARGIVFATGHSTEVGKYILDPSGEPDEPGLVGALKRVFARGWDIFLWFIGLRAETPLQVKVSMLALSLFLAAGACMVVVVAVNGWSTEKEVLIYAISTGISMVPIALPVVLSITMARGARSMKKHNVIVRSLRSLESLGGVTGIYRPSNEGFGKQTD